VTVGEGHLVRTVNRLLVIGAEGAGIAELAAAAGLQVDVELQAAPHADLVLEVIGDDLVAKQELLLALDAESPSDVVLITATRGLRVADLAARCADPERVVGALWSSRLVELAPSDVTSETAVDVARAFVESLGLQAVVCRKDHPGMVSQRLAMAMLTESLRLVDEGVATVADVERVAVGMYRHATGPFEAVRRIGLEEAARAAASMSDYYRDERFAAARLLATMRAEG